MKKLNLLTVVVLTLVLSVQVFATDSNLTNRRFVSGAMSLCALNETIQSNTSLSVYVLGDASIAKEIRMYLLQNIGSVKVVSIGSGRELPEVTPDVMLVCDASKVEDAVEYCRDNKVFSIANQSSFCQKGLSSAIVAKISKTYENKYSMTSVYAKINKEALYAEGMVFNSQVLDIAKPVENNNDDNDMEIVQLY